MSNFFQRIRWLMRGRRFPVTLSYEQCVVSEVALEQELARAATMAGRHAIDDDRHKAAMEVARELAAALGRLRAARVANHDCDSCREVRAEAKARGKTLLELLTPTIDAKPAEPKQNDGFFIFPREGLTWN